jgi:hypothetical protein
MEMTISEWLRHVAERRRAAFGPKGMEGCRYEEAAECIERLHDMRGEQDLEINKLRGTIERLEQYITILEIEVEFKRST